MKELLSMREREGANLKADLTKRIDFLQEREPSFSPNRMRQPVPMKPG